MRWYHLTCYLFQHLCVTLWRWISDTSITFRHQVKCSMLWWGPKSVCAHTCVCACLSGLVTHVVMLLKMSVGSLCRNDIIHTLTVASAFIQILIKKKKSFLLMTQIRLPPAQLAHICCSCFGPLVSSGCGLWTGLEIQESPVWRRTSPVQPCPYRLVHSDHTVYST